MELTIIQKIAVWAVPILFAISMHEVAHGWVASFFGDQTAKLTGRLSLNPLRHVDLLGTIIVPLLMLLVSNIIFGWAKPVPVDPRNLRNPRRDMAFVAIAGPIANIFMAFIWGFITKAGILAEQSGNHWLGIPLIYMGGAGVMINVVLAALNLIPIPPLDGARVLASFLPRRALYYFDKLEPYGFLILIILIFSGFLTNFLTPIVYFLMYLIERIYGLI